MAAILELKMAATLLDMQFSLIDSCRLITLSVVTETVVISPFRSEGSNVQFHDDDCIASPFRCHCAYQDNCPLIIVPVAYL